MSIVFDTAQRFGRDVEEIFVAAARMNGFTNYADVGHFRYNRYLQYNEIPGYLEDYCLQLFEPHGEKSGKR